LQGNGVALERRSRLGHFFAAEQGFQVRHVCAQEGVGLRIVFAQANAIEKEEKDFHKEKGEG
jgi:hypothetical protein